MTTWSAEFKRGRDSLEDDPMPGRPADVISQEMIDRVERFILNDRRIKKVVSIIRKYHNHKPQTNPWTTRRSHTCITRHQEDKLSKATCSLFAIKMIAKLEWTLSNVQQNIEQLQTPTILPNLLQNVVFLMQVLEYQEKCQKYLPGWYPET